MKPNTDEFTQVASIIDLGLSMLETQKGTKGLAKVGIKLKNHLPPRDHIYAYKGDDMEDWVRFFLRQLRKCFVEVKLTDSDKCRGEGSMEKLDWAQDGLQMKDWDPSKYRAGILLLNKTVRHTHYQSSPNSPTPSSVVNWSSLILMRTGQYKLHYSLRKPRFG